MNVEVKRRTLLNPLSTLVLSQLPHFYKGESISRTMGSEPLVIGKRDGNIRMKEPFVDLLFSQLLCHDLHLAIQDRAYHRLSHRLGLQRRRQHDRYHEERSHAPVEITPLIRSLRHVRCCHVYI